ncbi:MAG: ABC transporter ATP-binding protein [Lachnospiraceae bacterium]|jgi:oligopeptide/dipeptide ABC transporter ATP-binding protein|nr:ABC transporter ATP-binding protein [Lachnospiraceae bacterium]
MSWKRGDEIRRAMSLLEVKNLNTQFFTSRGIVPAVAEVEFHVEEGKVTAIIGESGSGKSVTAMSILNLVSKPGRVVGGEILFQGLNLLTLTKSQLRDVRGRDITMIFQEPMTSLNPVMTCGTQVREVLKIHHKGMSREQQDRKVIQLFQRVGIPDPKRRLREYPHQLSGGMRQRVMIAIALACNPKLLIADEPTTALDVTIQAQILELLTKLKEETGMAILLITHDFGVVAQMADEVIVMYAGQVQEQGQVWEVLEDPLHPYTKGLLGSIPTLEGEGKRSGEKLYCIEGTVPSLIHLPGGCAFCPRCTKALDRCSMEKPPLFAAGSGRKVRCWQYEGVVS